MKKRIIVPGISLVLSALAVFGFLTLNDPYNLTQENIRYFGWVILCPSAFILAALARSDFWVNGLAMIAGVTVGAGTRFLMPPHVSNLWPIAAAVSTVPFLMPIVVGSLIGGLGSLGIAKMKH